MQLWERKSRCEGAPPNAEGAPSAKRNEVKARQLGRNGLGTQSKLSIIGHEQISTDDGVGGVRCVDKRAGTRTVKLTIAAGFDIRALPPAWYL